jgi:hypothetical protein
MNITDDVKADIIDWFISAMPGLNSDVKEFGEIDITIGVNKEGTSWNYQTGDNSYTGGAYGLANWAVVTYTDNITIGTVIAEVFNQLDEIEIMY